MAIAAAGKILAVIYRYMIKFAAGVEIITIPSPGDTKKQTAQAAWIP